ncbi:MULTISPECIES: alpha/beta fold hydrolase [unclassified Burkholderia]|uniref:alpha/beta fold hydrolase n=1 Tax=unclassified Burkholderia TaxID=2613784 RepID=UPI00075B2A03|nr:MULTISPECIES: alpha/beta hydrolase [unclassified Burkholderia]KUY94578.1 alpha/beta hydrolase [Burkholderia sp. RF7-non_BP1]KUZ02141.1 alpha/beta hydrolase [Burkholderia sp. RF7-non_BP4]
MTAYRYATTASLELAYLEWNPRGERVAVLLHGWPDSPVGWEAVAETLAAQGYRVLALALRGFAPTRFRDPATPRSGQLAALGRDLLEFIDVLGIERPVLVGHDWGARAVANACGLRDGAASHLVMLSVGYGTNDPAQPLSLPQALCDDRRAFARLMWDTWSPAGWYDARDFDAAATAFDGPDWIDVVLHSYRYRWGFVDGGAAYADDEAQLTPAPVLSVPTLVLHGGADTCNGPETSARRERFFTGRYERTVLDGVGHFPQREAPAAVADAILRFCEQG